MMHDNDRKKVFWLLKKYSSYTAWKHLGDAYERFAKAYGYAMSHAEPINVDNQNTGWYKRILDTQILFEKGLHALSLGEKTPFMNNSAGYLWHAPDNFSFFNKIMDPDEFEFYWMKNEKEVVEAHRAIDPAFDRQGTILERSSLPPVAAWGQKSIFTSFSIRPNDPPPAFNFPAELADVPAPTDITVTTGGTVTKTGIWEPEWQTEEGTLDKGCMNYLLGGTEAPLYKDDWEPSPKFPVTWRLIWEDTRYKDGTIPEEEAEYLAPPPVALPGSERIKGHANEIVPRTGWWTTPALQGNDARRFFAQGEPFPDIQHTAYGEVIWTWDADKQG